MSIPRKLCFRRLLNAVIIGMLVSPALFAHATLANSPVTERVSISSAGLGGDLVSRTPSISADGRFIVFASEATNLVEGDVNGIQDIFLHDWSAGATERVSLDEQGQETDNASAWPDISADGSLVAFASTASNLVDGDTNEVEDVFVADLQSGIIERVSRSASGDQANAASSQPVISADGRFVAFVSAATNLAPGANTGLQEIYLFDRADGTLEWVSAPLVGTENDGASGEPAISADGNWIAFSSSSAQLVPGDTLGKRDIFLWSRASSTLERVSVSQAGDEAQSPSYSPALNADGRYIVFRSNASNLVAGDTNYMADIFLSDHQTGSLQLVNLSTTGEQALGGPSADPAISADGRFIVFHSFADNLVPNDTNSNPDIFLRDMQGSITRVSVDGDTGESNGGSYSPVISADGSAVAFYSDADNLDLVPIDDNGVGDVFAHGEPPTVEPTETPTPEPTDTPTVEPTETSTPEPSETPTAEPTETSTPEPSETPTVEPTETSTPEPSETPTVEPTETSTPDPSETPTVEPTDTPTVEPTVSSPPVILLKDEICVKEGETLELAGSFQDPDSERWTASVDYGDGSGIHELELQSGEKFELRWIYGDNGDYTATVKVTDDSGAVGSADLLVHVKNQTPRLESELLQNLTKAGEQGQSCHNCEGKPADKIGKWYIATVGEPTTFTISVEDRGSDDILIRWSFGDEATYFNDGENPDPFPSPWGTYPFRITHTATVVFDKPGARHVRVDVYDDDGGKVSMYLNVLVRGNRRCRASLGYWIHRFRNENKEKLKGELRAHLSILSAFVTSAFGEFRPEVVDALEEFILNDMDQSARARAQLLTAWLNFTNGSVEWDEVIQDADGTKDMPYAEVFRAILTILVDENATPEELAQAIELAESINLGTRGGSSCAFDKD